jgi:hypothetical protein
MVTRLQPPAITHPGCYYGFAGNVTFASNPAAPLTGRNWPAESAWPAIVPPQAIRTIRRMVNSPFPAGP